MDDRFGQDRLKVSDLGRAVLDDDHASLSRPRDPPALERVFRAADRCAKSTMVVASAHRIKKYSTEMSATPCRSVKDGERRAGPAVIGDCEALRR